MGWLQSWVWINWCRLLARLEKVHLLTSSQPYRLRLEVQDRSTNLWYSAEYWSFKIGDELNDKYRLEVSGYSGDTGDFLQYEGDSNGNSCFGCYYHNGMKFTTYDQDNDLADGNCAPSRCGGWWYRNCFWICLMCDEAHYEWWTAKYGVNSRMMIKPQWEEKPRARVADKYQTLLSWCEEWLHNSVLRKHVIILHLIYVIYSILL